MRKMKKYSTLILFMLVCVVSVMSCVTDNTLPGQDMEQLRKFKNIGVLGYYEDNTAVFALDRTIHQVYYTEDLSRYEITSEDDTYFLKCKLDKNPAGVGDHLTISLKSNSGANFSGEVTVVKMEENKIWLWDGNSKGVILQRF